MGISVLAQGPEAVNGARNPAHRYRRGQAPHREMELYLVCDVLARQGDAKQAAKQTQQLG